jgi:hypothetical protein
MSEKTFAEILEAVTESSRMMDAPLAERLRAVGDEVARLSPQFAATLRSIAECYSFARRTSCRRYVGSCSWPCKNTNVFSESRISV